MILNNTPSNDAILSNVGTVSSFTIKATAKSFRILADGLYANKIRAIVRELSCNAYDSHIAAGKRETPFDVHLPSDLEPHFSIRDYGVGLGPDQVTDIFTTFFESTKTGSNDFVGALGLGSKSPFSYTDNFTVTAIQNGHKGIYTAFINEQGVPSIALMMSEDTDEPTGVEIKFAVNDRYDFEKFRQEARNVYTYFAIRPVVSGTASFEFNNVNYQEIDIVPGVHRTGQRVSVAVMGNIAYPISIPSSEQSLGSLTSLLSCGLELHFGIGELDFQASREGLSYIPQTINAIKQKLELLNTSLSSIIAQEADAISNLWERALFLNEKKDIALWKSAVLQYAKATKFELVDPTNSYRFLREFRMEEKTLVKDYNIVLRGFSKYHGQAATTVKAITDRDYTGARADKIYWEIAISPGVHFVINNTKIGAVERSKYHWKNTANLNNGRSTVYIIDKHDNTLPMKTAEFFAALSSPPTSKIYNVTDLLEKPRAASIGQNVNILSLEKRQRSNWRYNNENIVWQDAGKLDAFDKTKTHHYVVLKGFEMQSTTSYTDAKRLYLDLEGVGGAVFPDKIYGVRKGDLEAVKAQPNWKRLEEHVSSTLTAPTNSVVMSLVKARLIESRDRVLDALTPKQIKKLASTSPYATFVRQFHDVTPFTGSTSHIQRLYKEFTQGTVLDYSVLLDKYLKEYADINARYPLMSVIKHSDLGASDTRVIDYINMVDNIAKV